MKKIFISILIAFIVPSIALAAWWNPFTWFQKNTPKNIETTIVPVVENNTPIIESNIQDKKVPTTTIINTKNSIIKTDTPIIQPQIAEPLKITQTPIVTPVKKASSELIPAHVLSFNSTYTSSVNFNNYKKIISSSYSKNYGAYLKKQIEITSLYINNFLPADVGGYIDSIGANNSASSQDEIMLYIDNADDYQSILNTLNSGDTINVYGLGMASKKIDQTNSYRTASFNYPVISVERIDRCQSSCSTIFAKTIPEDQGKQAGSYDKISLQEVLKDASLYTSTNFTTQVLVRDFMPYDNIGNYAVGISDPNNLDSLATVVVDANSKNQLQTGSLIEVSGHLRYIGSQSLTIDTIGSPIKIIKL